MVFQIRVQSSIFFTSLTRNLDYFPNFDSRLIIFICTSILVSVKKSWRIKNETYIFALHLTKSEIQTLRDIVRCLFAGSNCHNLDMVSLS